MTERWALIAGYPYEVSDDGRVRRIGGEPLTPRPNGKGYLRVNLYLNGERRDEYIHRLVCTAFHGPPPTPAHEVDHLNDDRGCNRAANLCWSTVAANRARRRVHRGESHAHARLTEAAVRAIRASADRSAILAKQYGVSPRTIRDARSGKQWSHVNG